MKYYIESKKGTEVLREFSRVCGEGELAGVLSQTIKRVQGVEDSRGQVKITVYSHDGLHNAHTIEEISSVILPESGSPQRHQPSPRLWRAGREKRS